MVVHPQDLAAESITWKAELRMDGNREWWLLVLRMFTVSTIERWKVNKEDRVST